MSVRSAPLMLILCGARTTSGVVCVPDSASITRAVGEPDGAARRMPDLLAVRPGPVA